MYNEYKIGREDKGLLILLAIKDRDVRIEVGAGLEEYINDAKAGRLMDVYAIPDFKENNFSDGLTKLQDGTMKELSALMNGEESTIPNEELTTSETIELVIAIIVLVALIVIIAYVNYDGGYGGGFFGGGSFGSGSSGGSSGFGGRSFGGGASRHF